MRSTENIEKLIKNLDLDIDTNTQTDKAVLSELLESQKKSMKQDSAIALPNIGRFIMKNPITKLTAAAVIIVVVILGLFEFVGNESKSGLAWAEIARNVEASPGVIWRLRGTGSRDPNDDWPNGYKITWRSAAITRTDNYRSGQIYRTIYLNYDAKIVIWVAHDAKKYNKETMSDEQVQRAQADKERWTDPRSLLKLCLSLEHHELSQKSIDGVLCKGIEATVPGGITGRMWIAVDTGYPFLVEVEAIDDKGIRHTSTLDQFQWNVDLSAEDVEPEIPTDYESLGLEGEMKTLSEQGKKELISIEDTMTDGTLQMRVHVYRYRLSDGRTVDNREGAGGDFALDKAKMEEYFQLRKAGPGENLGSYEETVEGRVFSFKREKYILSDGTEIIYSVGTPKDSQ